jgi:hypothetical protein
VQLQNLQFTDTAISGGVRVSLKSLSLVTPGGQQVRVFVDGDCVEVQFGSQDRRLCRGELFGAFAFAPVPLSARRAVGDLFSGFTKIGIDTSESGGQWYVNPVRTVFDLGPTLLSGLHGNDLKVLMHLGR